MLNWAILWCGIGVQIPELFAAGGFSDFLHDLHLHPTKDIKMSIQGWKDILKLKELADVLPLISDRERIYMHADQLAEACHIYYLCCLE